LSTYFFIRELKCFLRTEEGKVSAEVFVDKGGSGGLAGLRSPSIAFALLVVAWFRMSRECPVFNDSALSAGLP